jgi:peptide/nickel transport system substrate-binding protein
MSWVANLIHHSVRRKSLRLPKTKFAFLSVLGIAMMLVAACGSSTTTPGGTGTYDYTYTYEQQKPGGTIIMADWQNGLDNGGFSYINGFIAAASVNLMVTNSIWDGCLAQLPDISLGAAGWKPSLCSQAPTEASDGKTTTIHLDPQAKWSDGQPITADDYLFTFNLLFDANVAGRPQPYNLLEGLPTKTDGNTIVMKWTEPFAPYLGSIPAATCVHCYPGVYDPATGKYDTAKAQDLLTKDNFNLTPPATSGAYTIQSVGTDGTVTMVPNPNYHSNFFHKAVVDKLIVKAAGQKDVLIQSYKAGGNYDIAQDFTLADNPKFAGIPNDQIVESAALQFEHLEFNQRSTAANAANNGGKSIFADANVRKAFIEAFDNCAAFQALLGPNCKDPSVYTTEVTSPVDGSYDANAPIAKYNPSDAGALLDAAGYKLVDGKRTFSDGKTPLSVNIVTTVGNILRASYEQLFSNALSVVGVTVNVTQDKNIFAGWAGNSPLARGTFDIALFTFVQPSDDDSLTGTVSSTQIPSATNQAGQNYSGVNDPKIDQLLAQGRSTLDPAQRKQIYHDLLFYVAQQSMFFPLYARPNIVLVDPKVGNFKNNPTSAGFTWNTPDYFVKS